MNSAIGDPIGLHTQLSLTLDSNALMTKSPVAERPCDNGVFMRNDAKRSYKGALTKALRGLRQDPHFRHPTSRHFLRRHRD
ncbi:MAG: hypothetical protein VW867_09685, partial [Gammaproteobacteria bacterium]